MRQFLSTIAASILLIGAMFVGTVAYGVVGDGTTVLAATNTKDEVLKGVEKAGGDKKDSTSMTDLIKNIINLLLFIVGAVAVIMIILGGLRYVTSNGDQAQVKAAKETILYSVVGLIVAIMAFAIVQFVASKL